MKPAPFLEFLEETSGMPGRVYDVAAMLRKQGLFPVGNRFADRQVSIPEAIQFLWALFTNTTPQNLEFSLTVYLTRSRNGRMFIDDLNEHFHNADMLARVKEIMLPDLSTGFCSAIVFHDDDMCDSTVLYGVAGKQQRVYRLSGDYLREIRDHLITDKKIITRLLSTRQP